MTATNHALTGTAIGLLVGQPLIAIPAAIASHFVCDALPHFGRTMPDTKVLKSNGFRTYLIAEAAICFSIVVCLAVFQPQHWLVAAFCAFFAASPDLLWINRYLKARAGKKWRRSRYAKFAGNIQWFQRPIGAAVEVAWFASALLIILPFF